MSQLPLLKVQEAACIPVKTLTAGAIPLAR
jgi:hypothetical protein